MMQRSQSTHGSAPRVLLLMRAVVLALHWHGSLTYREIEDKVGVKERTASELVKRAKVCYMQFLK